MIEDIIRFATTGNVAEMIGEPLMGEGGIIVPPPGYWKQVKQILDRHEILLIADEVQSGFGRTGKLFAYEHYGIEPDMVTMAKGIAAGFPISACVTRDDIANAFRPGDHLSTFGGNPVACAAALANIEVMLDEKLPEQASKKGEVVKQQLNELAERHSCIGEIRGQGLMIGVELVKDQKTKEPAKELTAQLREYCLKQRILIGAGGVNANVIRFQPPLVISEEQLDRIVNTLEDGIKSLT
jgi:4-aminobutyrate aminotransferase-like enzyme